MNIVVTLEQRLCQTPDGNIRTKNTFAYSFWTRYLEAFDAVKVAARISNCTSVGNDWGYVTGENVSVTAIPFYLGPWQYLMKAHQVQSAALRALEKQDALIMRVPSPIANTMQSSIERSGKPYGLEVVGDPYDVFAPGAITHPLRPVFRRWFARQLRRQCNNATAVAYVTELALQRRYPPPSNGFSTYYSSIELGSDWFRAAPQRPATQRKEYALITVGTLAQLYKAPDVLIKAIGTCHEMGLNLKLTIIGDGHYRSQLEKLAAPLGHRIIFLGQLPSGEPIRAQLDAADLFIMPSRSEGLPRAMIEAMARGLPCIGSSVGGIPELLPPEDLTPPGDAIALANKIQEVISSPERMAQMSARNRAKAREYHNDVLQKRRVAFYRFIRERTQEWLDRNAS